MTTESPDPNESAIVPANDTQSLVEQEMPDASDEVKQKVVELIEAIKKQAQSEVQSAGDWTREAYLTAVQKVETTIKTTQEISEQYKNELQKSLKLVEQQAQTNWDSLTQEAQGFGDRLKQAAEAAWAVLTAPKPPSTDASPKSEESEDSTPEA